MNPPYTSLGSGFGPIIILDVEGLGLPTSAAVPEPSALVILTVGFFSPLQCCQG